MTPNDAFADLARRIEGRSHLCEEVAAIYQFDVSGDDGGTWTVDLKTPPGAVTEGPSDAADCVISVAQKDLVGIMDGSVDPQMAFLMGRIKVAGSFVVATKLRALMP